MKFEIKIQSFGDVENGEKNIPNKLLTKSSTDCSSTLAFKIDGGSVWSEIEGILRKVALAQQISIMTEWKPVTWNEIL